MPSWAMAAIFLAVLICLFHFRSTTYHGKLLSHCLHHPRECADWRLGWMGRPALPLSAVRSLLVVGMPSSGTMQMSTELRRLGLEVAHEVQDSTAGPCRDGTVSWMGVLRYQPPNARTVEELCEKPRDGSWGPANIQAVRACTVRRNTAVWDECWRRECRRIATSEIGCAVRAASATDGAAAGAGCPTPFRTTLLQVRHPLRTIESAVAAFCHGRDDGHAAAHSTMTQTLGVVLSGGALSGGALRGGLHSNGGNATAHECTRRLAWSWVRYHAAILPHADGWYRVEDTPPCMVLRQAGVLPPVPPHAPPSQLPAAAVSAASSSLVPPHILASVAHACHNDDAKDAASGKWRSINASHGAINRRNRKGARISIELVRRASGVAIAREMAELARTFGYGELQ